MDDGGRPKRLLIGMLLVGAVLSSGCDTGGARAPTLSAQEALTPEELASLVERISEPRGFFDTDNLISNEAGYLNVMDALAARVPEGGAYVGVGPPASPEEWRDRTVVDVVAWVDSVWTARRMSVRHEEEAAGQAVTDPATGGPAPGGTLQDSVLAAVGRYAIPLSEEDLATIRRFHEAFVTEGPDLRFNSFGRPPRPYYPTYRQLVTETDTQIVQPVSTMVEGGFDSYWDLVTRDVLPLR